VKLALALAVAVFTLVACPAEEKAAPPPPLPAPAPPPPPPVAAAVPLDPKAEAESIFMQRCSVCHGMSGTGDGPGAAALNPKPRNYTDPVWQKSVDDAYLAKVIVEGGAAVGRSPLMIANADLKDKPAVVSALVAKVRSFGAGGAK
jgi:mono/diheme cytochrome c family protein